MPDPSPSAAFCISGHARSFVVPAVHLSIKRNLIDAFGSRADVFVYFASTPEHTPIHIDPFGKLPDPRPARGVQPSGNHSQRNRTYFRRFAKPGSPTLRRALAAVHPVAVKYDRHKIEDQILGQSRRIAGCLALVRVHERTEQIKYDWFFRVRPDLLWLGRFPHHSFFNRTEQADVVVKRDWLVMTRRSFADVIFSETPQDRIHRNSTPYFEYLLRRRIAEAGNLRVRFFCHTIYGCDRVWPGGAVTRRWTAILCDMPIVPIILLKPWQLQLRWGCYLSLDLPPSNCDASLLDLDYKSSAQLIESWYQTRTCDPNSSAVNWPGQWRPNHEVERGHMFVPAPLLVLILVILFVLLSTTCCLYLSEVE